MPNISPDVKSLTRDLISMRRHLHSCPELGFEEHRTARFIAQKLKTFGVPHKTGVAKTGVVGLIKGMRNAECGVRNKSSTRHSQLSTRNSKTLLIRADIDALPIAEENNLSYKSKNTGVMHACGHDGHTAIALSAAKILNSRRERLNGNVKFMFQPGEEGFSGAKYMLKAGVLKNPNVDAAVALHLINEIPVGKIGVRVGPVFAISDEFVLKITGRGGHGAAPHETVDPIAVAANVIQALQNIVSRRLDPVKPAVLTIGKIEGGTKFNVIPDTVTLYGTVRAFEAGIRDKVVSEIKKIAGGVTASFGAKYELKYMELYPATVNDEEMCELVRECAVEVVGRKNVIEQDLIMGGEDMSFVLNEVAGCYFIIGSRNERKGFSTPHHSARFNFDEDAMPLGVEMMVRVAERFLNN